MVTPPVYQSQLSQQVIPNNFMAMQSVQLAVTSASAQARFNNLPGGVRVTMKITNTGSKGAYIAGGIATATAVVSTSTAQPTAGTGVASTCDYVAPGSIMVLDFPQNTDTIAAICAGSDTTTLEISIGTGQ